VHAGGDGATLPLSAGDILKKNALSNLRNIRIESGFDYSGFEITGSLIPRSAELTLPIIRQHLAVAPEGVASTNTRLIVSQDSLKASGDNAGFDLVVAVREGAAFTWSASDSDFSATATIDGVQRSKKFSAIAQDVFQDVMLGKDSCVQAILKKVDAAGSSEKEFLRKKADHARSSFDAGTAGRIFSSYGASSYASFASLARRNLNQGMDKTERKNFVELWTRFIVEAYPDLLLSPAEATQVVRRSPYHAARPELTEGGGRRPGNRIYHEHIPADELEEVLSTPIKVRADGAYILGYVSRQSALTADELSPHFGWRNEAQKSVRRVALFTEKGYEAVVPLVRKGFVTPFRLFLKGQ
jgi:hypothetical protein